MHSYGSFTINIHILGKESRANTEKPGIQNTILTNNYVQQNTRWAEHVERIGEKRGAYRVLMGNPKQRGHLEDLRVDGNIILKLILKKYNGRACSILCGTGGGHTSVSYEHGAEVSRSIKGGTYLA
jgi:hypothetical protein